MFKYRESTFAVNSVQSAPTESQPTSIPRFPIYPFHLSALASNESTNCFAEYPSLPCLRKQSRRTHFISTPSIICYSVPSRDRFNSVTITSPSSPSSSLGRWSRRPRSCGGRAPDGAEGGVRGEIENFRAGERLTVARIFEYFKANKIR